MVLPPTDESVGGFSRAFPCVCLGMRYIWGAEYYEWIVPYFEKRLHEMWQPILGNSRITHVERSFPRSA